MTSKRTKTPIRYAVVGLGYIAQIAVLPAFRHAGRNSKLAALVSDDEVKLRHLSRRYGVPMACAYEDYDALLHSGKVDAVYIALPNHLHCDYVERAANAGVHVLCEKPLAVDERECEEMVRACAENRVHLMTAYRLHFERANLEAVKLVRSGRLGEPRIFNSVFTMQVKKGNIRLNSEMGGGTLYDIGIYCINAARYLFGAEPTEVCAVSANNGEARFREVDEMTSAILRFPAERLAAFTSSFGAADTAVYEVIGTKGHLRVTNAYEYSEPITFEVAVNGKRQVRKYARRDQFAAEIVYFSDCVLKNKPPEPSGVEGLIDVHIIRCLYASAQSGQPVLVRDLKRQRRPSLKQEIALPAVRRPELVHSAAPTR